MGGAKDKPMTIYGISDHVTIGSEGKGHGNPGESRAFARSDVQTRAQSARHFFDPCLVLSS